MPKRNLVEAINHGLMLEMERDPSVVLLEKMWERKAGSSGHRRTPGQVRGRAGHRHPPG